MILALSFANKAARADLVIYCLLFYGDIRALVRCCNCNLQHYERCIYWEASTCWVLGGT